MNDVYPNAFSEVLSIISLLPNKEKRKISNDLICFLDENKNSDYIVNIDLNKSLENQDLLEETKEILKEIYLTYFCSSHEKEKIIKHDKYVNDLENDIKFPKYGYEDIFKKASSLPKQEEIENKIIKVKKSKIQIFIEKINSIFKR